MHLIAFFNLFSDSKPNIRPLKIFSPHVVFNSINKFHSIPMPSIELNQFPEKLSIQLAQQGSKILLECIIDTSNTNNENLSSFLQLCDFFKNKLAIFRSYKITVFNRDEDCKRAILFLKSILDWICKNRNFNECLIYIQFPSDLWNQERNASQITRTELQRIRSLRALILSYFVIKVSFKLIDNLQK